MQHIEIAEHQTPCRIDCFSSLLSESILSLIKGRWELEYTTGVITFGFASSLEHSVYKNEEQGKRCIVLDGFGTTTIYFTDLHQVDELEDVYQDLLDWMGDVYGRPDAKHGWFWEFMRYIQLQIGDRSFSLEKNASKPGSSTRRLH